MCEEGECATDNNSKKATQSTPLPGRRVIHIKVKVGSNDNKSCRDKRLREGIEGRGNLVSTKHEYIDKGQVGAILPRRKGALRFTQETLVHRWLILKVQWRVRFRTSPNIVFAESQVGTVGYKHPLSAYIHTPPQAHTRTHLRFGQIVNRDPRRIRTRGRHRRKSFQQPRQRRFTLR